MLKQENQSGIKVLQENYYRKEEEVQNKGITMIRKTSLCRGAFYQTGGWAMMDLVLKKSTAGSLKCCQKGHGKAW